MEMFYIMIWVVNIQVYRYVKFAKPYVTIFVLYFKEEKRILLTGKKNIAISGARLDCFGSEIGYFLAVRPQASYITSLCLTSPLWIITVSGSWSCDEG